MIFRNLFNLFYSFGKEEYSIFERPSNIIGSFFFALFFYALIIFGGSK